MPAPVTVDLSAPAYAGDAPVGIDLSATGYAGDPPVTGTPTAHATGPQIGSIDGGTPTSTYVPTAVIDSGSL